MSNARHAYWTVDQADRSDVTADIVREFGSTMVFCRTRHGADRVAKRLTQLGVAAAPIHGGLSQPKRDKALKSFVDGDVEALVATDVAARGVHVDDVAAVVHFDPAGRLGNVRPPFRPHRPRRCFGCRDRPRGTWVGEERPPTAT